MKKKASQEKKSPSQDFVRLFRQIGRIQNAVGGSDVAIKHLPLIVLHHFFPPFAHVHVKSNYITSRGSAACIREPSLQHDSLSKNDYSCSSSDNSSEN